MVMKQRPYSCGNLVVLDVSEEEWSSSYASTTLVPKSALKTRLRIPLQLQAVFLESCRTGIVHQPPPCNVASKIFPRDTLSGSKSNDSSSQIDIADQLDDEKQQPLQVAFGWRRTVSFDSLDEACFDHADSKLAVNRWSSQSSARDTQLSLPKMPKGHPVTQQPACGVLPGNEIRTCRWRCPTLEETSLCLPPKMPSRSNTRSTAA